MNKQKRSGPAIFMYAVIGITAVISVICFVLYYFLNHNSFFLLWTGIVSFMIMYHLWTRIIMGNVTKLIDVNPDSTWFREKKFEKTLYRILKVKKWKGSALTYNPESFSLKANSLESIAHTMTKSELDHWVNEIISLSAVLFSLIWGKLWIFVITSVAAMLFDAQFIVIQRYNRPRVMRIIKKAVHKKERLIDKYQTTKGDK